MSGPITLKVHVDPERCQGHNRCYSIAPELFEIDEYGTARAKGDGMVPPALEDKVDICQNATDLAISLGLERPKVAILAAVETVTSKMQATVDAACLCKMAERGQITNALLDGPLAFDNAISTWPRHRDWRFSKVRPGWRSPNDGANICWNVSNAGSIEIVR